ncbi:hypothetical protein BDW75DRAFT_28463 [Aspergillus navahoensis]
MFRSENGCSRCKARSLPCTYTKSKRARRNSEASARAATPSIEPSQLTSSDDGTPPLPDLSTLAENPFDDEWQNMSSWLLDAWTEANAREGPSTEKQRPTGGQPPQEETLQKHTDPVGASSAHVAPEEITALARLDKNQNAAMGGNTSASSPFGGCQEELAGMAGMAGNRRQIQPNDPQHWYPIHDYELTTMLSASDLPFGQNNHQISSTDIQSLPSVARADYTDKSNNSQGSESQQLLSPPATRSTSASTCFCSCANDAFQVLGDLQVSESKSAPTAFDNHLNFMKRSLDRGFNIMDCLDCVRSTAVTTLLTAICERLVVSFEAWARQYYERSAARVGKNPDSQGSRQELRTFFFGAYEISMGDERCSILRALAIVQLRRLARLLGRMGDVAMLQGWTERKAALDSLLSRTEGAASGLIGRF